MKIKNFIQLATLAAVVMFTVPSCVKEGPIGETGPAGADQNETCKICHSASSVDRIATQFEFSKHSFGEAAFEEAGNTGCTPCHAQEAFNYVVTNNIPATFTLNTTTNKYVNDYATVASHAYGELGCATCHNKLHTTYGPDDLALTTVAPVPMTMWAGTKTIDLQQDGGASNLCVKCHQPRPFVNALTSNIQDYVAIAANPTGIMYDGTPENPNTTDNVRPSYRMHTHYGTAGAVFAGKGGVEFAGPETYRNSKHTTDASCIDCHMGAEAGKSDMVGRAGGHSFVAKGNFTTCNTAGCHEGVSDKDNKYWVDPRKEVKTLLDQLAAKLTINGVDILNRSGDAEHNLWYGLTTNNYDGYLNVYDPINNPSGTTYNTTSFKFVGNPPASWSQAQKDYNATLPTLTLTNAQFGALINFQLCLRDYSLGIHNLSYTKALLKNSIAILP